LNKQICKSGGWPGEPKPFASIPKSFKWPGFHDPYTSRDRGEVAPEATAGSHRALDAMPQRWSGARNALGVGAGARRDAARHRQFVLALSTAGARPLERLAHQPSSSRQVLACSRCGVEWVQALRKTG
jgi:hypothetical protein